MKKAVAGADSYDIWIDDVTTGQSAVLRDHGGRGTARFRAALATAQIALSTLLLGLAGLLSLWLLRNNAALASRSAFLL